MELADHNALDRTGGFRHIHFLGTLHYTGRKPIKLRNSIVRFRFTRPKYQKITQTVLIQVTTDEFVIICRHVLLNLAVIKGVNRHTAQHLIGNLTADYDLHAAIAVNLQIFHKIKGCACTFNGIQQHIVVCVCGKNMDLQRLVRAALGKEDIFRLIVAIQVRCLNRLPVFAGERCRILLPNHHLIDLRL